MIQTLHISNYALIDSIDITLHPGLNILTGETGAGKSIILGALSLLLGGRCDTKAVRNHEAKSVIEATFSAAGYPALQEFCQTNELDWDADTVILRREIAPNGRSRAFVNDCPVNLSQLQTAALHLIDIHSQHQNLLLASPPYQLRVIDSLAGNGERLEAFTTAYNNYRHAVRKFKQERKSVEQAKDDEEFLRFQYKRLKDANLAKGELDELEHERELLVNMADVKTSLATVTGNLSEGDENIDQLLRQTIDESERLGDLLEDADTLTERLRTLRVELLDIAETFSEYDRELTGDPERLDEVEERLNLLYDLMRRHKVETVDELISIRDDMKTRLQSIDLGDENLQALELAAKRAKKEALEIAAVISQSRHEEAERFAKILKDRALPLGMKNLQCEITVRDTELSSTGIDHVEFLFAFNKNQPLLPVGNTASGGEISRLMLSIKSIVADKMQLPSIIFDEVDTGVSGDVADKMGELMRQIAANIQVIAITHLPQVASKGHSHYKVFKEDTEQATVTRIKELGTEERVKELAVMLSGSSVNDAALANARSLLSQNN
ncbi:DNA repair protein RecN [uncultured Duncaniella sp.]|jgi:DNA repair protein RecN (Recombination protein N)|uniref:DNA repair protein RecN n=1 Tax=uncultured Duncaniella sp. TaxID=2768039 RepID=UPI0025B26C81|nr:DNA repair protein RecN [uncultured Duncaniella sp.]